MWSVDRTGGECSKTVFRHMHGRSVHCSTDRIIVHTVVHASPADLAPRHGGGSGTTHTRATERRALGALTSAPRAGVLLLASPLVLAVGLQAPFDRGFTFPEQRVVPRALRGVIAYTEHADALRAIQRRTSRSAEVIIWDGASVRRTYTSIATYNSCKSVTCVRWTARV